MSEANVEIVVKVKSAQTNEPFVLDVFVDAGRDENGDDGVIPARDEH